MEKSLARKIERVKERLEEDTQLYFHRIGAVFDIAQDLKPVGLHLEEIPEEDREFYVSSPRFKKLLSYYQLKDLSLDDILSLKKDEPLTVSGSMNNPDGKAVRHEEEVRGSFDAINIFQKEVSRYPVFSEEEETELIRKLIKTKKALRRTVREVCKKYSIKTGRMQYYEDVKEAIKEIEGRYLKSRGRHGGKSKVLANLLETIKEFDTEYYFLRQKMTKHNLRLVFFLAKKYRDRELPLLDLIQEGNIGLMKAVDRYQPAKGKFSTYAGWYIEGYIKRSIAQHARTIRLPIHVISAIKKLYDVYEELSHEFKREPTYQEIARRALIPLKKVRNIMESGQPSISIHSRIEGKEGELADHIEDDKTPSPADTGLLHLLQEQLGQAILILSDRGKAIIALRFGIGGENPKTLEDIGQILGLTRERVRQIEKKALRILAQSNDIKPLKDFIG